MNPHTEADRRARVCADLRLGLPVRIVGGATGEILVLAAGVAEDRWLRALRGVAGGAVLALTRHRAETLRVPAYDGDVVRLALDEEIDAAGLRALADPTRDLAKPLKGPFRTVREGDAEGARLAVGLVRDSGLLPAAAVAGPGRPIPEWATECACCRASAPPPPSGMELVAVARLPVKGAPDSKARVYRDPRTGDEHVALVVGAPDRDSPPLVRVHSSCLTGDLLGSLRCDCGGQLAAAVAAMVERGAGVLIVLQQEGRGIGLANKMRAYRLQDLGYDTYEANRRMGFAEDHRDFAVAAEMLRGMGHESIRLLSGNPEKSRALERAGIEIAERLPLVAEGNPHAAAYLRAKAMRHGRS